MPSYDYRCVDCDITVEVTHGMKETPVILCACCDRPMQKQIGKGGGVIFRGKGFYAVDYSNDPRIRKGQK
jgi:putative FmdB family regulatory protein